MKRVILMMMAVLLFASTAAYAEDEIRGRGEGGIVGEIDLTEEQREKLDSYREELNTLIEAEELTREDIRDSMREKVDSILTEDQKAAVDELREDRQEERQETGGRHGRRE